MAQQYLSFEETLDLSNNAMTGTVPLFFKNLTKLDYLNLQGNQFSGGIPEGLCSGISKCKT